MKVRGLPFLRGYEGSWGVWKIFDSFFFLFFLDMPHNYIFSRISIEMIILVISISGLFRVSLFQNVLQPWRIDLHHDNSELFQGFIKYLKFFFIHDERISILIFSWKWFSKIPITKDKSKNKNIRRYNDFCSHLLSVIVEQILNHTGLNLQKFFDHSKMYYYKRKHQNE